MRKRIGFVSLMLLFASTAPVFAQDFCAENTIPTLEQQLSDIESRETQLRIRLEELAKERQPPRTERALAGSGSTRPEELREHRRKSLTIERSGLQTELDQLEESQASTESEIVSAESAWFLKYAQPAPACPQPGRMKEMIALTDIQDAPGLLRRAGFAVLMFTFAICGSLRVMGKRIM